MTESPPGARAWLPGRETRRQLLLAVLLLALPVGLGCHLRIDLALHDANFDQESPEGMLRSDPGLLYYFVQRLVEHGGWPPDDWDADPRVEHPHRVDLQEDFTIAQEYLAAWSFLLHRKMGGDEPLHVWCVLVFAVIASLAAVGVYGLAWELTRRPSFAFFAAMLYALMAANYRTIGFILIREDLALPCLAAHLWLLARAVRLQTRGAFVLAALALLAALSSWHAMRFTVAIELGCVLLWFLVSGRNPFSLRGAGWGLGALVLLSFLVPVLRSKWFVLSLPMQILGAMAIVGVLERRGPWASRLAGRGALVQASLRAGLVLVSLGALFGLSQASSAALGAGHADYSHVFDLVKAKFEYGGEFPDDDPAAVPFGARLLWQGPFDTGKPFRMWIELAAGIVGLGLGLVLLLLWAVQARAKGPANAWRRWLRRELRPDLFLLVVGGLACLVVAYLIVRNVVLCGLLLPVLTARVLSALPGGGSKSGSDGATAGRPVLGWVLAGVALLSHASILTRFQENHRISWYVDPGAGPGAGPNRYQAELARLVAWLRANRELVPQDEAILADFVTSTTMLAGAGNPIVLQPKYETAEARRRTREFLETIILQPPEELRRMMARYECRFLLLDRMTVFSQRSIVGVPEGRMPPANGAILRLGSRDPAALKALESSGFRLLYRSPPQLHDLFRLYEVRPLED